MTAIKLKSMKKHLFTSTQKCGYFYQIKSNFFCCRIQIRIFFLDPQSSLSALKTKLLNQNLL